MPRVDYELTVDLMTDLWGCRGLAVWIGLAYNKPDHLEAGNFHWFAAWSLILPSSDAALRQGRVITTPDLQGGLTSQQLTRVRSVTLRFNGDRFLLTLRRQDGTYLGRYDVARPWNTTVVPVVMHLSDPDAVPPPTPLAFRLQSNVCSRMEETDSGLSDVL